MKKNTICVVFIFTLFTIVSAQNSNSEVIDPLYAFNFSVTDGTGIFDLKIGFDPQGTSGMDTLFGEYWVWEPCGAPSSLFCAFLAMDIGADFIDIRYGDFDSPVEHQYSLSAVSDSIYLSGYLTDVAGDIELTIVDPFGGVVFEHHYSDGEQVSLSKTGYSFGRYFLQLTYTPPPVPVELTNFSSQICDQGIELNWSTATESNNARFEVERSSDKIQFNLTGSVDGAGTTTEPKNYSFIDILPLPGINYYRLKQIDFSGDYQFSDIIEADFTSLEFALEQNYPNPFNPSTSIKYQLPEKTHVKVEVFNMLGQSVKILADEVKPAGYYETEFTPVNLASGVYICNIKAGKFDQSVKMVYMK